MLRRLSLCSEHALRRWRYCQSLASVTWSGDDWHWSTHGNSLHVHTINSRLPIVSCSQTLARHESGYARLGYPQAVQLMIMFRLLQVRAMHKQHIYTRNSAHDFSIKLGHAYVSHAYVSHAYVSHTDSSCPGCWHMWYLAIYLSWQILLCAMTNQFAACSGSPHDNESLH